VGGCIVVSSLRSGGLIVRLYLHRLEREENERLDREKKERLEQMKAKLAEEKKQREIAGDGGGVVYKGQCGVSNVVVRSHVELKLVYTTNCA